MTIMSEVVVIIFEGTHPSFESLIEVDGAGAVVDKEG